MGRTPSLQWRRSTKTNQSDGAVRGRRCTLATGFVLSALFAWGCSDPRPPPRRPLTWREDVGPLLAQACVSCHGPNRADGAYRLDTYLGALGNGTDAIPNAIAGDPESALLRVLDQEDHRRLLPEGSLDLAGLLRTWVVDDRLAYFYSPYHPPGVLNARDADFHGRAVAEAGWRLDGCRRCHQSDPEQAPEDSLGPPCLSCHIEGAAACDTCHPDPGGAHARHLHPGEWLAPVSCDVCHPPRERLEVEGHGDGQVDVVFSGVARSNGAAPAFDAAQAQCTNTWCHGGLAGAEEPAPRWYERVTLGCTGCHGFPPMQLRRGGAHLPGEDCTVCHTLEPASHPNGEIDLAVDPTRCDGCHSGPGSPLPFRGLHGETDPALPAIGAHSVHLAGSFFARPLDCADCHQVPDSVTAEGHLDAPPAEVVFSGVATAGGRTPAWEAASATCSDTWCHGAALDGGQRVTPPWNGDQQVGCGSCHGVPPEQLRSGAMHPKAERCGGCHGQVIDDRWQWVDLAKHLDGQVEVGP